MIKNSNNVDDYIKGYPKETQAILKQLREIIKKAAPKGEEAIKYGIPTIIFHGNLVHFGAYPKHIGFYPGPSTLLAFRKELSDYKGSKGAVQFPLDKPLPLALVTKMVKYRVKESIVKAKELSDKKK